MLSPLDLAFWQVALPTISMLTLPVAIFSGASLWRSFLTASVVYGLIVIMTACNIAPPF